MITPENLILALAGALGVVLLARLLGPKPSPAPIAAPTVTARVLDPGTVADPAQLLGQLEQSIQAQARALALAYSRGALAMIEAQAKVVPTPWSAPAIPPAADVPKA